MIDAGASPRVGWSDGVRLGGEAVELAKKSDAATGGDITVVQSGEVTERLDELEARVAELEESTDQPAVTEAAEPAAGLTESDTMNPSRSVTDDMSPACSTLDVDVSDEVWSAVEAVAESWNDAPDRLQTRKAAAAVVLQHALSSGKAVGKSSEIVATVREQHPVEGQNAETHYRKNIRLVLNEYGTYSQGKHGYIVDGV